MSVFQAAVIKEGYVASFLPRGVVAYGVEPRFDVRGILPADNPDYTDRQKQYNPSFFIPKTPFRFFVVNNAKTAIHEIF